MIIATEVGYRSIAMIGLLVMAMNISSMLAVEPIIKFVRPVTLCILSFILGVMQFALGIQFMITAIEIQVLVLQILLRGEWFRMSKFLSFRKGTHDGAGQPRFL
jgi:multiple antibiotic resistance protein